MQGLFDFLKKYSYWLLFILLEGGSLLLLFRFNLYQGSVWFTSANTVSGRVLEWESDFLSYIALGERNKDLMRKNLVLEQRVRALTELLDRAEHDSTYTEMRQRELLDGFGMVPAEVVSNSVNRHNNYLTINKGELDGVKPEMGVVCGTGIVGIVYLTSLHYAIVMPLLNSKSNISCCLRGTDYFGYLRWDGRHPCMPLWRYTPPCSPERRHDGRDQWFLCGFSGRAVCRQGDEGGKFGRRAFL